MPYATAPSLPSPRPRAHHSTWGTSTTPAWKRARGLRALLTITVLGCCQCTPTAVVQEPLRIERLTEWPAGPDAPLWAIRGAGFTVPTVVPVWREIYGDVQLDDFELSDCHAKSFRASAIALEGSSWLLYQEAGRCGGARCAWVDPRLGEISAVTTCPPIIAAYTSPRYLGGDYYELFWTTEGVAEVQVVRWRRGDEPTPLFSFGLGSSGWRRFDVRNDGVHLWSPCDPRHGCGSSEDLDRTPPRHFRWRAEDGWHNCTLALGPRLTVAPHVVEAWSADALRHARNDTRAVRGTTAFILAGGAQVLAIAIDTPPRLLGALPVAGARALAIVDDRVVVASDDGRLHTVDDSLPTAMRVVASTRAGIDVSTRLRSDGERLWVVGDHYVGLFTLDEDGAPVLVADHLNTDMVFYDVVGAGPQALLLTDTGAYAITGDGGACHGAQARASFKPRGQ